MRRVLFIVFILICGLCFGQEKLFNNDGTLSDEFKRKHFLEIFSKANKDLDRRYDIEGRNFVIIIKQSFGEENIENKDKIQLVVVKSSLYCLTKEIEYLKNIGYKSFLESAFEGIIFKINTLIDQSTRRYTFKFSLTELSLFPEYIDSKEIFDYIVKNENKNIIEVKN